MLAFLPFMSIWLEPAEAGEAGVLRILAEVFAGVMILGLPTGVIRLWHRAGTSKRAILRKALAGCLAGAVVLGAAILIGSGRIEGILRLSGSSGLTHAFLLGFGAALVQVALSFHRAEGRARTYFRIQTVRGLSSLILLPILFLSGMGGIISFLSARWIPAVACAILAIVLAVRIAPRGGGGATGLFRFSLPLMPAGLALLVLSSADMFMLRNMAASLVESGYYEWASSACMALTPITLGFGMAWQKHIFSMKGVPGGLAALGRHSLVFITGLEAAAMLLALFSPEIVGLVGGPDYSGASRVLPILAGATALYGVYLVAQTGPMLEGRTWMIAVATILGAGGNVIFNYRLIPSLGASGAALATLGTNLFMAGSLFWVGRRGFPVSAPVILAAMAVPSAMGPLSGLPFAYRLAAAVIWTASSALLVKALLGGGSGSGSGEGAGNG
jgi:O-antigen/teichoic acid export membrane protein